jgi:hypothetical protein
MRPLISMRRALAEPDLLGEAIPGDTWRSWRVMLIALLGEPLDEEELSIFAELTGGRDAPLKPVSEAWLIMGRRSGKTRAAATAAAYFAALCDWSDVLAPGERGTLPIMSASIWQAGKAREYVDGIFNSVPALRSMILSEGADTLSLNNGVDVVIRPASYRTARSMTAVAVIADEACFWATDETSRNVDKEIIAAVRPALSLTGGPLIVISSPYARKGAVWGAFKRHYGPDGDPAVLVARAPSRRMNALLSQATVDRALAEDAAAGAAEYLAEFRSDVETFVSVETVEAAVTRGVVVRPLLANLSYRGFVDPSGGSSDSMTMAIAHREGDRFVLDLVLERKPPFSPEAVVREFAATLKGFHVSRVRGDRYAAEWSREAFRRRGVTYEPAEKTKSEIYLSLLPMLNSGRVELLDNQRLISQLCSLERRTARGGRDSIDHAPGAHDDVANAAAGALVLASTRGPIRISDAALRMFDRPEPRVFSW